MASTMRRKRAKPYGVVLGEKIRERRLALGLEQAEVAAEVGMTAPRLCALEKGKSPRGPAPETLGKLAAVLRLRASDLLPLS